MLRLAFALVLTSTTAHALPVLRLAFTGDATTLASGAVDPFDDLRLSSLTLERPALLDEFTRPTFAFRIDHEATIEVGGDHFYAGTRAADFQAQATLLVPFELFGVPFAAALAGELDDGSLRVRNRREGVILDLVDQRRAAHAALSARPWRWLRLGAAAGVGAGSTFALEAAAMLGPAELGFVRRSQSLEYDVAAPPGPKRKFQRPELTYDIRRTRQTGLVTARLGAWGVDVRGWWDALNRGDFRVDAAWNALSWLTVRGHVHATEYEFDDWAANGGELVARVDLGVKLLRWAAGADATWGAHRFVLRAGELRLSSTSDWQDLGAVTAQRFLSLDADFDLYLRHAYEGSVLQFAAGWRWVGERWTLGAGAQHLVAFHDVGTLSYGSEVLTALSGKDVVLPAIAKAVVLTGGASYRLGDLTVRASTAQLVPYAGEERRKPAQKPPPPPKDRGPKPPLWEQISKTLSTIDGGRLLVLEVEREF